MKVQLIGKTEVEFFSRPGSSMPGKAAGSKFEKRHLAERPWGGEGQDLIEFAGRLCYESFDLPNEDTKTNSKYVRNIISLGHESVLEHVSVSFYIEGVSRNLTHELIRHRHLSFSELSQRYVDMEDANVVIPPASGGGITKMPSPYLDKYNSAVESLKGEGKTRKQAREAARYGLPSGTETKLVVSGNLRAWRDMLKKRYSKHADAEMQEFASWVRGILGEEYPDVFWDIKYEG